MGIRDFSSFIDSQTFKNVIADLYYQSSSDDDFISQVWQIIGQLSNYTSEEEETPRFPSETIFEGGGDCEDLSILFASLIKAAGVSGWLGSSLDSSNKNDRYPVRLP